MADTIRNLTDLLALLPDNTSGDISPQDVRDVLVSVHGVYGELLIQAGAAAQGSISTTPAKVTGWNANGLSNGTTPDHATDNDISVGTTGIYLVLFSISISAPTASTKFSFEVYKNAAAAGQVAEVTTNATPDEFIASGMALVSCSANDNLELFVYADGASKSITPTEGQMVVLRVA